MSHFDEVRRQHEKALAQLDAASEWRSWSRFTIACPLQIVQRRLSANETVCTARCASARSCVAPQVHLSTWQVVDHCTENPALARTDLLRAGLETCGRDRGRLVEGSAEACNPHWASAWPISIAAGVGSEPVGRNADFDASVEGQADRALGFSSTSLVYVTYVITSNFDINLERPICSGVKVGAGRLLPAFGPCLGSASLRRVSLLRRSRFAGFGRPATDQF